MIQDFEEIEKLANALAVPITGERIEVVISALAFMLMAVCRANDMSDPEILEAVLRAVDDRSTVSA